jgi:hypothetical protein
MTLCLSNGVAVIERATNLVHWQKISTNDVVNGIVAFAEATAGLSPAQFYRVHINP